MKRYLCYVFLSISLFAIVGSGIYAAAADQSLHITPVLDKKTYTAGDSIIVALKCRIPEKFHLYSNPLGPGVGRPLNLILSQNNGITWLEARKSKAKKFQPDFGDWVWAYENEALFFIIGTITDTAKGNINDTVTIDALICHTACVPLRIDQSFTIPITRKKINSVPFEHHPSIKKSFENAEQIHFTLQHSAAMPDMVHLSDIKINMLEAGDSATPSSFHWQYVPREKTMEYNIFLAIILAFFAGVILNVMPCVLPVLGVKILSFSENAKGNKKNAVLRSLAFAAGMISIFLILATFAAFAGLSWGEQFQNPVMLVVIICIIFVFSLGLFDVFMMIVPSGIAGLDYAAGKKKGFWGDFTKGVFTTILATPCSGPFLGATLAWTLLQRPVIIYTVFIAIGCGMAAPYVLFSTSSSLMKLIPKPGKWMDDFKHVMGFLLIGFAVYLMIGLPEDFRIPTIGLCVFLALAVMVYSRFAPYGSPVKRKIIVWLAVLGIGAAGWYLNFVVLYSVTSREIAEKIDTQSNVWEEFSVEKLNAAHASGQHVLVDFTALWCMNCQFNKITVYQSKEIQALLKEKNIRALRADLTNENPPAMSLLHHLGSRSVPFCAVFPADQPNEPFILRDIIRKKDLVKILQQLADEIHR